MCDPVSLLLSAGGSVLGNIIQQNENKRSADIAKEQQLSGIDQAKKSLSTGLSRSESALKDYSGRAEDVLRSGFSGLKSLYDPYSQAGIIGLKGYQSALQDYMNYAAGNVNVTEDPLFKQQSGALNQQLARMGLSQSPTAVMNSYTPLISDLYSRKENLLKNTMNAYNPLIQYGYGATGSVGQGQTGLSENLASNYSGMGTNLSNLYGGYYGNIANLDTGGGDISAQATLASTPQYGNMLSNLSGLLNFRSPDTTGGSNLSINPAYNLPNLRLY